MKKILLILSIAVISMMIGYAIAIRKSSDNNAVTTTPSTAITTAPETAAPEVNPYNPDALTLPDMLSFVNASAEKEYDHRLLLYLIVLKQYEIGMMKSASDHSQQDLLKTYSVSQVEQNEQEVAQLLIWQKQWGLTHH